MLTSRGSAPQERHKPSNAPRHCKFSSISRPTAYGKAISTLGLTRDVHLAEVTCRQIQRFSLTRSGRVEVLSGSRKRRSIPARASRTGKNWHVFCNSHPVGRFSHGSVELPTSPDLYELTAGLHCVPTNALGGNYEIVLRKSIETSAESRRSLLDQRVLSGRHQSQ